MASGQTARYQDAFHDPEIRERIMRSARMFFMQDGLNSLRNAGMSELDINYVRQQNSDCRKMLVLLDRLPAELFPWFHEKLRNYSYPPFEMVQQYLTGERALERIEYELLYTVDSLRKACQEFPNLTRNSHIASSLLDKDFFNTVTYCGGNMPVADCQAILDLSFEYRMMKLSEVLVMHIDQGNYLPALSLMDFVKNNHYTAWQELLTILESA